MNNVWTVNKADYRRMKENEPNTCKWGRDPSNRQHLTMKPCYMLFSLI